MAGNYPYTGTILENNDGSNKTSTSLSVHMLIKVNNTISVGAIQSLDCDERGTISMITEVGTDGVIDSVRNKSVEISGSCERIRFSRTRIAEAFGRSFIHVQSQAYPFDIWIYDRQAASQSDWVITVIKNVWIESIKWNLKVNDWVMADSMTWKAETIKSYRGTPGTPAATGGETGITLATVSLSDNTTGGLSAEQAADVGLNGRRGSLDVPGLIDAVATY